MKLSERGRKSGSEMSIVHCPMRPSIWLVAFSPREERLGEKRQCQKRRMGQISLETRRQLLAAGAVIQCAMV